MDLAGVAHSEVQLFYLSFAAKKRVIFCAITSPNSRVVTGEERLPRVRVSRTETRAFKDDCLILEHDLLKTDKVIASFGHKAQSSHLAL